MLAGVPAGQRQGFVDGPGEAREADIGVAFAKKGGALIFRKGEIVGKTKDAYRTIAEEVKGMLGKNSKSEIRNKSKSELTGMEGIKSG